MIRLVLFTLLVFIFVEEFGFVHGNKISLNGSLPKNNRLYKCMSKNCAFSVGFDQDIVWPDACQELVQRSFCGATLSFYEFYGNQVEVEFFDTSETGAIIVKMMGDVQELLSTHSRNFISTERLTGTYEWAYFCANDEDQCDKNFVQANLQRFIKSITSATVRSQLKNLLYSSNFDNQKQCYVSSTELTACPNKLCLYEPVDNSVTFRGSDEWKPVMKYSCGYPEKTRDPSVEIHIDYTNVKALAGSKKYDGEYTAFDCNIDKCNGPSNINKIIGILKNTGMKTGFTNTFNILSILITAYIIIWNFD